MEYTSRRGREGPSPGLVLHEQQRTDRGHFFRDRAEKDLCGQPGLLHADRQSPRSTGDMVIIIVPSRSEAAQLRDNAREFRGFLITAGATPPDFLLSRAIRDESNEWAMPRLFVDEAAKEIVGSGCFKSEPKDRRIEIGYGVAEARRGRGYATTGVGLMIDAAFASGVVDVVIATSLPTNVASRKVLEKLGFSICGSGIDEKGPVEVWEKVKSPNSDTAE